MRRSQVFLFVGALLLFCTGAPAAASGTGAVALTADQRLPSSAQSPGDGAAPQLVAAPPLQRAVTAATNIQRRMGDTGLKVLLLCTFALLLAMRTATGRVDNELNARLLRVSNTPCAERGPPNPA